MKNTTQKILGILLLTMLPILTFAQPKAIQRFEIGYSFPMTSATYTNHYSTYDVGGTDNSDTTFSRNVRSKGGFGITLGSYFPISKLSDKSSLNISVDFLYNLLVWDNALADFQTYDETTGTYTTYSNSYVITAATVHWGLPVGFDFKYGGEATLDKSNRLSFTLGTGVYPSMNLTVFDAYPGAKFKMQPYLKAELGVFAGVNIKVRALYSFGKLDYLNYSDKAAGPDYGYESSASLVSKSCLTLSVMVMPVSFRWGKETWWR